MCVQDSFTGVSLSQSVQKLRAQTHVLLALYGKRVCALHFIALKIQNNRTANTRKRERECVCACMMFIYGDLCIYDSGAR